MQKGAGSGKKSGNRARTKRNYHGTRGKFKREQGAKRNGKRAGKIVKEEQVPKNRKDQGERSKTSKGAGSIDPP